MSESSDGKPVERRAVLFLSGHFAPVLAHLLCEAEARYARDPFLLKDVLALRQDLESQVRAQFPERGWLFNHDD